MGHLNSKLAKLLLMVTALASLVVLLPRTSVLSAASPLMPPDWSPMHGGTGHDLHGVWGSSHNDVFALGDLGTILHYDGTKWTTIMKSGTKNFLYGVWGNSHNDVFAVGGKVSDSQCYGVILHYDGSSWSTMSSGTTNFLTVSGVTRLPTSLPWARMAPFCTMMARPGPP